jgi:hypothetical protein
LSAADELGIPAEPPPGHVPSEPYHPPPAPDRTIEGRLAALEQRCARLELELEQARRDARNAYVYAPHPYNPHHYCHDR